MKYSQSNFEGVAEAVEGTDDVAFDIAEIAAVTNRRIKLPPLLILQAANESVSI